MNISHFNDLLEAARQQPDAQRLLLVFAGAGLPDDATPEQQAAFEAGHGGELTPLMCVHKTPDEIGSFDKLGSGVRGRDVGHRAACAVERRCTAAPAGHGRCDQGGANRPLHPVQPGWRCHQIELRRRVTRSAAIARPGSARTSAPGRATIHRPAPCKAAPCGC